MPAPNQLPLVEPEIVPVGATIDDTLPITVEAPEPAALSWPCGKRH
ncbi:hypothetical protein ACNKHT_09575 [Shigella flexneri]